VEVIIIREELAIFVVLAWFIVTLCDIIYVLINRKNILISGIFIFPGIIAMITPLNTFLILSVSLLLQVVLLVYSIATRKKNAEKSV